jgi:hypothetical protein
MADLWKVPGRRALLLISSGVDTFSNSSLPHVLNSIRSADIPVYCINLEFACSLCDHLPLGERALDRRARTVRVEVVDSRAGTPLKLADASRRPVHGSLAIAGTYMHEGTRTSHASLPS